MNRIEGRQTYSFEIPFILLCHQPCLAGRQLDEILLCVLATVAVEHHLVGLVLLDEAGVDGRSRQGQHGESGELHDGQSVGVWCQRIL